MKILITGNLGYVGSVLAKTLKTALPDSYVIGMDSAYFASCQTDTLGGTDRLLDAQYYRDTRDVSVEDFKDVDVVVHLAALSNDPMGNYYTLQTTEINYGATAKIAMLAKEAGVKKFIFASSCSVYGFSESGICDETSTVNPLTEYARTKVLSERFLRGIATDDFQVICFRFATACGSSPRLRLDLVLNDFVASAITIGKIEILSDGTPWRPLIDVKNMARAIQWASVTNTKNRFSLFNAGSNEWNFQVKDIANIVAEEIPGTEVYINSAGQPDKRSYKVNFDAFTKESGINIPKEEIRDTVKNLFSLLKSLNFSDNNFRKSSYMRLNMLKTLEQENVLDTSLRFTR